MSAAEVSSRHLSYRLQALRVLQLIDGQRPPIQIAPLAYRLLDAKPESDEERALFAQAIKESPTLCHIAPRLLAEEGPTAETLAAQIKAESGLSRGTSLRRARVDASAAAAPSPALVAVRAGGGETGGFACATGTVPVRTVPMRCFAERLP